MILERFPRLTKWLFGDPVCHIDSGILKMLEDLYEVLFSRVNVEYFYRSRGKDPREAYFSEIQADICSKFGLDSAVLDLGSSTLEDPNAIRRVSSTPVKQTYQVEGPTTRSKTKRPRPSGPRVGRPQLHTAQV
ncbi:hypothetical protein EV182_001978, partial [Spiromyces aspiralis]